MLFLVYFSDHSYKTSSPLLHTSAFHFMSESDSGTSSTTPPSSPIRQKNKKGRYSGGDGLHMGLDARKPVFGGLPTTKAQTSLCIRAVWSAPLLFAYKKVSYLDVLWAKFQDEFLACLGSWGDWFETRFVRNPEDRFSRSEAHMWWTIKTVLGQTGWNVPVVLKKS